MPISDGETFEKTLVERVCPSTHGGAGYPLNTIITPDGVARCPACGEAMTLNEYAIGPHVLDARPRCGAEMKWTGKLATLMKWLGFKPRILDRCRWGRGHIYPKSHSFEW